MHDKRVLAKFVASVFVLTTRLALVKSTKPEYKLDRTPVKCFAKQVLATKAVANPPSLDSTYPCSKSKINAYNIFGSVFKLRI